MRKKVTYRPSKSQAIFGGVGGSIFVLIGIFVIIPTFGVFGIFWTLVAAVIAGTNFYQGFGKKYVGPEIHIEEDIVENNPSSAEERLKELRQLYEQRLITQEEYEKKRQEILSDL